MSVLPTLSAENLAVPAHHGEVQPQAFRGLMQGVAAIAGLTHISFLALFYWAGVDVLAVTNVFSVLCYVWIFLLARGGQVGTAFAVTVLEVLGHAMLATFVIGWGSGFHHYILLVIPVMVVSPIRPLWLKVVCVVAMAFTYIGLAIFWRNAVPPRLLASEVLDGLFFFNVFGTILILTFLAGFYFYLISRAHAKLSEMANTDPLTQLRNRRSVLEAIRHQEGRMNRGQPHLSFVLCDIDHFKGVNDTRGHDAGDLVLKAVSKALAAGVRDVDFLARWGGEEFLAVLPDTDAPGAALVAERLRRAVEALEVVVGNATIKISLTLGVATLVAGESAESVIGRADAALYEGKRGGRNCVVSA